MSDSISLSEHFSQGDTARVRERWLVRGFVSVCVGLLLLFFGLGQFSGGVAVLFACGCGSGLLVCGLLDIVRVLKLCGKFERLCSDESGLGWQILVFLSGVVAFGVVWFVVAWPADIIFNAVTGVYAFSGITLSAINLVRGIIGLLVGLGLLFLIIWLWVNVNRREDGFI
jgi:hypothetical protein